MQSECAVDAISPATDYRNNNIKTERIRIETEPNSNPETHSQIKRTNERTDLVLLIFSIAFSSARFSVFFFFSWHSE